ncbi:MAG: OmpH family outer membrane protein [Orrella sp.]
MVVTKLALVAIASSALLLVTGVSDVRAQSETAEATAQTGSKIGFVNTQRILRDSKPAQEAQTKIDAEFENRNEELQKLIADLRKKVQAFEKDAPVLPESDRNRRQRELGNLDSEVQRKQREIQEDFNRRRNEEFAVIIEQANVAIKTIADEENYDLILQDAVTVSPRVDITDKVIKALD